MELEDFLAQRGVDRLGDAERAACERMTADERELFVKLRNERDEWLATLGDPVARYRLFMASFGVDVGGASGRKRG